MAYGAAQPRGEEKFRLILGQIASIRSRLNALALQHGLFAVLTFLLCAAALVMAAAFFVGPLSFLVLGVAIAAAAAVGVIRTVRAAWRMHADQERAARIADERAMLKGRLTTMVGAARGGQRSSLWPYLVEDTLSLREEFATAKIEPRRVSRWLYAALASSALAALVFHSGLDAREARLAARHNAARAAATVDLGDLDIRPADPSLGPGADVDADPATMRKLAEKLRSARKSARQGGGTGRLMADARDVANALQNKLTGGKRPELPPTRLKLTDRKGGGGSAAKGGAPGQSQPQGNASHNGEQNSANGQQLGPNPGQPGGAAPTPGFPDLNGLAALNGLNGDEPGAGNAPSGQNSPNSDQLAQAGPNGAGGSQHGSGSDPNHLFGDPEKPSLGNETFRIPIEAAPSDDSFGDSAPAYQPARVKSKLNQSQAPDEPFERASIPASDRVTIKRVFER